MICGIFASMTDISEIKQKIDIVSFISEYVPLKKTGANFKGLCPFHSEKTPSFVVSAERQIWHCFGGCNDGGDAIKFLMKIENIEFFEALKILAKKTGVKLATSFEQTKSGEIREKLYEINHLASEFYDYILISHSLGQKAQKYLEGRKISSNSIKLFSIGYAPASWDSLTKFLLKKGYGQEDLFKAGLISRSGIGNLFDRFRGRVIFTLRDQRSNVVGFAGRLLDPDAKEAKYINTAETPVYIKGDVLYGLDVTKDEIKKEGFAVVVEGEIDCIQSYQAGVRNVVAIKGSALTGGQVSLLKRYTDNVYLALDSDFAGDLAVHRGILAADEAGLNIKVVTFNQAKDPDELIKNVGPASWREAVKNAVNFYDFIIDSAVSRYDSSKTEDLKKIISETAKYLVPIDNLVVSDHYIKKLAMKIGANANDLDLQMVKEFKKSQFGRAGMGSTAQVVVDPIATKPRSELLEEYLLAILLQCPRMADYLLTTSIRLRISDFENQAMGKIYQLLQSLVDNPRSDVSIPGEKFDINALAKFIPAELEDFFNKLYLMELNIDLSNQEEVLSEIQKTVWEIKELTIREKLKKISGEIRKSSDSAELERDFTDTMTALQKLLEQKMLISSNHS